MKKHRILNLAGLCALWGLLLCTGCAAGSGETNSAQEEVSAENSENSSEISSENSPYSDGITDIGRESDPLSASEAVAEGGVESETGPQAQLTIEELKQFTDFANQAENNGFLLSQYDQVSGADLNEILYNGAGMEQQPLTEEERKAYEEAAYPVETDLTRLTTEQIESFLRRKAGIGLEGMTGGLDWVYLEDFDSYVFQHGDTNFCTFVCTGGMRTGELYELRFKAAGEYVSDCVTTMRKNGDDYQFVSNRFFDNTDDLRQIRKIEDQSFTLELESWGKVEFVSYEPDIMEHFQQDVSFCLEQDGGEVFSFPQVRDGNQRVNDRFDRIDAVAFKDYDQDGYTDIIIICTYEQIAGEEAGREHQEVRIYKGGENVFRYMDQLCYSLNVNGKNQSISQVLEEIGEESPDLSGMDQALRRRFSGGWQSAAGHEGVKGLFRALPAYCLPAGQNGKTGAGGFGKCMISRIIKNGDSKI